MRRRGIATRIRWGLGTMAAVVCLIGSAASPSGSFAAAGSSGGATELASRYASQVRAFLPLLGGTTDPTVLAGALGDLRRAVVEIDQIVAGAYPVGSSDPDPEGVRNAAAAAHLHLAMFETRAHDFEAARQDVERARQLLGVKADGFRAPWSARQEGGPGRAPATRYDLQSLPEFELLLQAVWSEARPVVFDLNTVTPRDLGTIAISEAPGAPARESDSPLIERAAAALKEAIASGQKSISLTLPAGTYNLTGRPGSGLDRLFMVPESSEADPVVVGTDRFAAKFETEDRSRFPRFFLNGVEVTDLSAMPYGYYRLKTDERFVGSAPRLIRFIPGLGIDNRSKTVWTVFVPRGEMTVLRFGPAPPPLRAKD